MIDESELIDLSSPQAARHTVAVARQSVSVVEWLEHGLHPWTSFVILPIFALANAGVPLSSEALDAAARSPITLGIVLGLVVGKTVGITMFAWLAVRVRVGELPAGGDLAVHCRGGSRGRHRVHRRHLHRRARLR